MSVEIFISTISLVLSAISLGVALGNKTSKKITAWL